MRIAVCDDETVWMEQTKKRLEQIYVSLDLLVDTFSSGKQLLERAKSVSFDLVILDIEMPKMDGLQVAKSLRAMGTQFCNHLLPQIFNFLYGVFTCQNKFEKQTDQQGKTANHEILSHSLPFYGITPHQF